ncbi:MAG: hypothetical protein IPG42_15680 [Betaproteobacteria bacterium]|nr:hypothetical protein [Betaproteobacteria bacterium]
MLSIAPLASPDYYLGSSASSGEPFTYFEADKGKGVGLPGEVYWLAMQPHQTRCCVMADGSAVTAPSWVLPLTVPIRAADFEAIYYGLHPRSGQPLRSDGKSRLVQMTDAKERAACKQALEQALRVYNPIRAEVRTFRSRA